MYSISISKRKANQSNIKVTTELMPGLHLYADILEYGGVEVRDSLFYRKGADLKPKNSKTRKLYLKNSQNLYLEKVLQDLEKFYSKVQTTSHNKY